jgi:rare lipoprotein A
VSKAEQPAESTGQMAEKHSGGVSGGALFAMPAGEHAPRCSSLPVLLALPILALQAWACATARPTPRVLTPTPTQRTTQATYTEEGLASWYGEPYNGRPTASGPRYDMWAMTAAHRTLPFGTRVRVHNLANGRDADVLVNDRGPFVAGRILDLSRGAAERLDAIGPGVIPIRLEVAQLGDGMPDEPCWEVQVGAFAHQENVDRARVRLETKGLATRLAPASGGLTRVRATAIGGKPKAEALARSLAADFPGAVAVPCGGGW